MNVVCIYIQINNCEKLIRNRKWPKVLYRTNTLHLPQTFFLLPVQKYTMVTQVHYVMRDPRLPNQKRYEEYKNNKKSVLISALWKHTANCIVFDLLDYLSKLLQNTISINRVNGDHMNCRLVQLNQQQTSEYAKTSQSTHGTHTAAKIRHITLNVTQAGLRILP